eukprot:4708811-Amphidinium_carterae.1
MPWDGVKSIRATCGCAAPRCPKEENINEINIVRTVEGRAQSAAKSVRASSHASHVLKGATCWSE